MTTETNINHMIFNQLSESKYSQIIPEEGQLYCTPDYIDLPILTYQYTDHLLNDQSWLRADTFSWQDGTVYEIAYQHLSDDMDGKTVADCLSETVGSYLIYYYLASDGHKIVTPDQETTVDNIYNESGSAWYYIWDSANKRFKLPRSSHGNIVEKYENGTEWYRVYSDGWCEQGGYAARSAVTQEVTFYKEFVNTEFNVLISARHTADSTDGRPPLIRGRTTTSFTLNLYTAYEGSYWQACGYLASGQYPNNNQYKYLYFFIGQFSKSATLQSAGINSELFNQKVDKTDLAECHVVVETWTSGTNWYRVWSDGWCEQGGYLFAAVDANWRTVTQTLHKPYKNTNYYVGVHTGHTAHTDEPCVGAKTTTNFVCYPYNSSGNSNWHACGYIR